MCLFVLCKKTQFLIFIDKNFFMNNEYRVQMIFSPQKLCKRERHNIFKVIKRENLHIKIVYPAILLFKIKGEIISQTSKT